MTDKKRLTWLQIIAGCQAVFVMYMYMFKDADADKSIFFLLAAVFMWMAGAKS